MIEFQAIDNYTASDIQNLLNDMIDKSMDDTGVIIGNANKFPQAKGFERGELVLCQKFRNTI